MCEDVSDFEVVESLDKQGSLSQSVRGKKILTRLRLVSFNQLDTRFTQQSLYQPEVSFKFVLVVCGQELEITLKLSMYLVREYMFLFWLVLV